MFFVFVFVFVVLHRVLCAHARCRSFSRCSPCCPVPLCSSSSSSSSSFSPKSVVLRRRPNSEQSSQAPLLSRGWSVGMVARHSPTEPTHLVVCSLDVSVLDETPLPYVVESYRVSAGREISLRNRKYEIMEKNRKLLHQMDSKTNMVWCHRVSETRVGCVAVVSRIERSMKWRTTLSAQFNSPRACRLYSSYEDSEKKIKGSAKKKTFIVI